MSRRSARKNAFYLLFQMDFSIESEFWKVKEVFFNETDDVIAEEDKEFILKEVEGVKEHISEIDEMIANVAKGWTIDRMSKVDLAILRLAVYEMKYSEDTPVSVAVNEAVELAKKFSSDQAPAFINGILGNLA